MIRLPEAAPGCSCRIGTPPTPLPGREGRSRQDRLVGRLIRWARAARATPRGTPLIRKTCPGSDARPSRLDPSAYRVSASREDGAPREDAVSVASPSAEDMNRYENAWRLIGGRQAVQLHDSADRVLALLAPRPLSLSVGQTGGAAHGDGEWRACRPRPRQCL
jgi:hypothetical protein